VRLSRGLAALSLASALTLTLGACSGDADPVASPPATSPAPTPEPTVTEEPSTELTAENVIERITTAHRAAGSVTLSTSVPVEGETMTIAGDVNFLDGADDLRLGFTMPDAITLDVRRVGGTYYLGAGEASLNMFNTVDIAGPADGPAGFGQVAAALHPAQSIGGLAPGVTSLEKSGDPVVIDGVETQPYTLAIDVTKLDAVAQEAIKGDDGVVPPTMSVQLWISADDLVRKHVQVVGAENLEFAYTAWGAAPAVAAPAPEQITAEPIF
jgi:hypothetical protein